MIKQRFIIVCGKGGVGRTSVACALATALAKRGNRTLIATSDSSSRRLSALLGKKINTNITLVGENLWAVNVDPVESVKEYILMTLKLRSIQNLLTGTAFMQSFITSIPGIAEWAVIGKVTWHLIERKKGNYVYDKVILDAPATGHSFSLLKIPLYINKVIHSGPLHEVAKERWTIISDGFTTGIAVVVVPEEMVITETFEFLKNINSSLSIPVITVFVNRVIPPLFDKEEVDYLKEIKNHDEGGEVDAALFRIMRTEIQRRQIDRLKDKFKLVIIPDNMGSEFIPDGFGSMVEVVGDWLDNKNGNVY